MSQIIRVLAMFGIVSGIIMFIGFAIAHQPTWYWCGIILIHSYNYWYHTRKIYLDKVFGDIAHRGLLIA